MAERAMSRMDRFPEDFKKMEVLERQIKDYLKERQLNVKQGLSTAKVSTAQEFQ